MLILPPGHAQAGHQLRPLRPREKRLIRGGLAVMAAAVIALVIGLATSSTPSGRGCVTVALAYSTGGDQATHCGAAARSLCAGVGHPGGITGAPAQRVAAACRKAGLTVG